MADVRFLVPSEWYTPLMWAASIGFLAAMPLLLAARAHRPQRIPWWFTAVLAVALGWIASNVYAQLESAQINAKADELYAREGIIAHFFVDAPSSFTLPWGWAIGLVYLVICWMLYPLFRLNGNVATGRPLIALLIGAAFVAIFSAGERFTPAQFAVRYAFFLLCVGLAYQAFRVFRRALGRG